MSFELTASNFLGSEQSIDKAIVTLLLFVVIPPMTLISVKFTPFSEKFKNFNRQWHGAGRINAKLFVFFKLSKKNYKLLQF